MRVNVLHQVSHMINHMKLEEQQPRSKLGKRTFQKMHVIFTREHCLAKFHIIFTSHTLLSEKTHLHRKLGFMVNGHAQ